MEDSEEVRAIFVPPAGEIDSKVDDVTGEEQDAGNTEIDERLAESWPVELHQKAFELYCENFTLEEIAARLGVSPNTLKYWKSSRCKCSCGYHDWVNFKKKLKIKVPTVVVETLTNALKPQLTAAQLIAVLEKVCAEVLTDTKNPVKPRTWRELLETFKLILELRRVYMPNEESSAPIKNFEKSDIHQLVDHFMEKLTVERSVHSSKVVQTLTGEV